MRGVWRRARPSKTTAIIASGLLAYGLGVPPAVADRPAGRCSGATVARDYTADTMTVDSDMEPFLIKEGTLWSGRRLYELYEEAATPWEWHDHLNRLAGETARGRFPQQGHVQIREHFDDSRLVVLLP